MTLGRTPSDAVRAFERHLRNSHAIGRLIVDGLVARVIRPVEQSPSAKPTTGGAESTTHKADDVPTDLPLPEEEWRLLSSGDVVEMLDRCDDDTVRAIGRYEDTHRRRRLVVEAVRRRLGS
jgi:hypothetical protein